MLCVAVAALTAGITMDEGPTALDVSERLTTASQSAAPTHDGASEVVLDTTGPTTDGRTRVVGWALDSESVEVLADGDVFATVPVAQQRMDVASALDLSEAAVGFDASVAVPTGTHLLCVARPGRLPGPDACDRPLLHLPRQRVVAFYGVLEDPGLGTLGAGSIDAARDRLLTQAKPYITAERPVMPAFELIATVAQAFPGDDNSYSHPIPHRDIRRALRKIREVDGILVLDLQTGRDTFMEQLRPLEKFLREPDVHLALDPEWHMRPGERPNIVIGHAEAAEVNEVMEWLDALVVERRLPRKLLVVHNFRDFMITDRDDLDPPSTVDLLVHMDGHGPPSIKTGNYKQLVGLQDAFAGFKLFYQRDVPLMSPQEVFAMDPDVDFISYQ